MTMINKPKKILYLDMDGVLADFDKAIKLYCPDLHTSDAYPDYETRSAKVDAICEANPDIFQTLEPIEDSIESVKELDELFRIFFLSTPMWNVPNSYTGKRLWLVKIFGESLVKKKLILTHNKELNIGDYLVDDRTRNGAGEFTGELILLGSDKYPTWKGTMPYLRSVA